MPLDPSTPPSSLFFDLGGTLFRYGGSLRQAFNRLLLERLERHGVRSERARARAVYACCMEEAFRRFARRPYYRHRDLFAEGYAGFLAAFERKPDPGEGLDFYFAQMRLGIRAVEPRAGAAETLRALRERGFHLGVVSNIDDDQFHALWERMGLAEHFHATTTSEGARSCKPHSGIFAMALKKAGDPEPGACLFVGDSPVHDVAGARALGMRTALITSRPSRHADASAGERADHVIGDLAALLEITAR